MMGQENFVPLYDPQILAGAQQRVSCSLRCLVSVRGYPTHLRCPRQLLDLPIAVTSLRRVAVTEEPDTTDIAWRAFGLECNRRAAIAEDCSDACYLILTRVARGSSFEGKLVGHAWKIITYLSIGERFQAR